jgi:hypothetical protein
MIQENEIVMLMLGIGASVFILVNRLQLNRLPSSNILLAGFSAALMGWILTVLEGFFVEGLLNILEHMCYAASSLLVAVWCWRAFGAAEETG